VLAYVEASRSLVGWGAVPDFETPFVVTRAPVVLVAETAP